MSVSGYWRTGEGGKLMEAVSKGELSFEDAYTLLGVPRMNAMYGWRSWAKHSGYTGAHPWMQKPRLAPERSYVKRYAALPQGSAMDKLMAVFTAQVSEFAAAVLTLTNETLVKDLDAKTRLIAAQGVQLSQLEQAIREFRSASARSSVIDAKKILEKAGLHYAD